MSDTAAWLLWYQHAVERERESKKRLKCMLIMWFNQSIIQLKYVSKLQRRNLMFCDRICWKCTSICPLKMVCISSDFVSWQNTMNIKEYMSNAKYIWIQINVSVVICMDYMNRVNEKPGKLDWNNIIRNQKGIRVEYRCGARAPPQFKCIMQWNNGHACSQHKKPHESFESQKAPLIIEEVMLLY